MDMLIERCAGLDVHQATVVATVRVPGPEGRQVVTETFGTMTPDLLALREWLQAYGVTYQELGADYFDRRHAQRAVQRHVRQLEALGYQVTINKAA